MAITVAGILLIGLSAGLGLLGFAFWIWMIIDCATKEPSQGNDKIVWIIIVVFAPLIGALIYYFVRRPTRARVLGQRRLHPHTGSMTADD